MTNEEKQQLKELMEWKEQMSSSFTMPLEFDKALTQRGFPKIRVIFVSTDIDFGSILAEGSEVKTFTVPGVKRNDPIAFASSNNTDTGIFYTAFVSDDGVVSARCDNQSGSSINPGKAEYKFLIFQQV